MDINAEIGKLDWSREPKGLYEPIGYTLAAGGKRVRPQLALFATKLFGGKEEDVLPAALALEVFHNFTLLHDDVMDKAPVRRGRPTVHVKWNENTAILSGDQMMIEAYKLLNQVPEKKLAKTLRLFNKMATEICEGQQYDVDFESRDDVTIPEYMEMIRLKTSVLLATALQIGAYIGYANEEQQQKIYEYGIHVGLAFQIQDDMLDCYGDEATFGKAIGGDIAENKKTYLWLTAAAKGAKDELAMRDECRDERFKRVMAVYKRLRVKAAAEKEIAKQTDAAIACLEDLPQNEYTEQLRAMARKLADRSK